MADGIGRWKRPLVRAIKLILAVLIVWMVARALGRTWDDLSAYGRGVRPSPAWLVASGAIYLLGLCCFGVFFAGILRAGARPVGLAAAMRAYLIGHLGKYVPGKALVVVLRVGLVVPYGARPVTAAFATLYETLVMMASGGLVAGLLFAASPGSAIALPIGDREVSVPLSALSMAVGLPLLVLAQARIFPKLAMAASIPFPGVGPDALPRFSGRLLASGLLWSTAGWLLMGLSLAATVEAIEPGALPLHRWPAAVAAAALATVAGFVVAIFPGGLVIREAVLTAALGPLIGAEPALVAALVLRLVWVVAELLAAGPLAAIRPPLPRASAASSPSPPPVGPSQP